MPYIVETTRCFVKHCYKSAKESNIPFFQHFFQGVSLSMDSVAQCRGDIAAIDQRKLET
jgi:hypothetical protein